MQIQVFVLLAIIAAGEAKPSLAFGPPLPFATPLGLSPPVLPAPSFHHTPYFSEALPFFPPPAPVLPAAIPAAAPIPCPVPLPLARALPPIIEPYPFTPFPTYRAIPGPVTKTHHISYGLAYPGHLTRFAAPHAHLHQAPLPLPLPEHHHHLFA